MPDYGINKVLPLLWDMVEQLKSLFSRQEALKLILLHPVLLCCHFSSHWMVANSSRKISPWYSSTQSLLLGRSVGKVIGTEHCKQTKGRSTESGKIDKVTTLDKQAVGATFNFR